MIWGKNVVLEKRWKCCRSCKHRRQHSRKRASERSWKVLLHCSYFRNSATFRSKAWYFLNQIFAFLRPSAQNCRFSDNFDEKFSAFHKNRKTLESWFFKHWCLCYLSNFCYLPKVITGIAFPNFVISLLPFTFTTTGLFFTAQRLSLLTTGEIDLLGELVQKLARRAAETSFRPEAILDRVRPRSWKSLDSKKHTVAPHPPYPQKLKNLQYLA